MKLPDGEKAPSDGLLPRSAAHGARDRDFAVYLHVPFCRVRCGYCDFNTYTAPELGPPSLPGASQEGFAQAALAEVAFARDALARSGVPTRPVHSVFFGGGTPTLLPAADLVQMLDGVRDTWGLTSQCEVTTEANPDSVDLGYLQALAAAGFTRVSFGVQSFEPQVLATLDRTHDPKRVPQVVGWAREAGLAVSLDLIYGTPGESLAQWGNTVRCALELAPDHISAYALTVEPGTALHRRVERGELPAPTGDDEAAKYELVDGALTDAGYRWYEISNWARTSADECRHNLAYWSGADWWGVGPGAHSHVGGVRWWSVKHPRAYAARLVQGISPAAGRELLEPESRHLERVMLGTRLSRGFPTAELSEPVRSEVPKLVTEGLLCWNVPGEVFSLTRRGRLLADVVVGRLT